jgi:hypothetical protein
MPHDEPLEQQSAEDRSSERAIIPSNAEEWGSLFVRHLEIEFADRIVGQRDQANGLAYQKAMMSAIAETCRDSGASATAIQQLIDSLKSLIKIDPAAVDWNDEKNARRLELIDRSIRKVITPEETLELDRLTAELRAVYDREEYVPLEGARRLLERLKGSIAPEGESK